MKRLMNVGAAVLLAGAVLIPSLAAPAQASRSGRLNTTLALGGIAAYELLNGNTVAGLLAAGGTAYAYKRYDDARDHDRRWDRYDRDRDRDWYRDRHTDLRPNLGRVRYRHR